MDDVVIHAPNEMLSGGIVFSIPIGGLTNTQKQELALGKNKKMWHEIERKYNNALISQITGITDEEEIVRLKVFCNFTNEFILTTPDYDVAMAILDCYEDFKKKN